jgi:signal transduction histidine kinase/AmiR/NasT family two-component response regulator
MSPTKETEVQASKILRIDPTSPYSRQSIVITTPDSSQPILPSAAEHASYLSKHCAPLESELLHQVSLFKAHLRTIESGPEFWRILAKGLTNLLGAQYACISKRLDTVESNTGVPAIDEEGSCILALAWYYNCGESKTGLFDDVKYTGYRAPCSLMKYNTTALVPNGLSNTFPHNPNQSSFIDPAEAYLSVPMFDGKAVNVGHICLLWTQEGLDRCPYTWTTLEFVLHVFVEMATQRFLENLNTAFELESQITAAAAERRESTVLPSPSSDHNALSLNLEDSKSLPSLFLPFPAAIAANISHEIRTPLQGIVGLLEIFYAQLDTVQNNIRIGKTLEPTEKDNICSRFKSLIEGIQDNSNRLIDFADKLGEYYDIATDNVSAPFKPSTMPLQKRKTQEETDEEVRWDTGGAQRKFLKRRKLAPLSTTEVDDSSSTDHHSRLPNSHRHPNAVDSSKYEVSIRSTIRQIVKHVLTRHEVAAIWGGKMLGLMTLNPETKMRSILIGQGDESVLLEWNVSDDVPRWLYCGKAGLQKVITHLLVNAIKFTPSGRITLRVTREMKAGKAMVLFSIKDTGIGVKEQDRHLLAQPFFQADGSTTRSREGSGLGLLLSKRWAAKMGGQLRLENTSAAPHDPDRGSEFSLRLPIHKNIPTTNPNEDSEDDWIDIPRSVGSASEQSSPLLGRSTDTLAPANYAYNSHLATIYPIKIMVVEDNEILRRVMAQLLEKLGYHSSQVVLCNNGLEAVDYFRNRAPRERDIDLILMDCWMPILDGLDATRQILDMFPVDARKYPGIKPDIVAITADNLPANLAKTEDSGMRGYMVKPIKLNDLQRVVEECAEGNWFMKRMVL